MPTNCFRGRMPRRSWIWWPWNSPKLVEDLVPKHLPLSAVQRVLQNLLRERVSIRDSGLDSGGAGRGGAIDAEPGAAHRVCPAGHPADRGQAYWTRAGNLPAYFVDRSIEQAVESAVQHGEQNSHPRGAARPSGRSWSEIQPKVGSPEAPGVRSPAPAPAISCAKWSSPPCRNLFFLSHNEIPAGSEGGFVGSHSIERREAVHFANKVIFLRIRWKQRWQLARREMGATPCWWSRGKLPRRPAILGDYEVVFAAGDIPISRPSRRAVPRPAKWGDAAANGSNSVKCSAA